MELTGIHHLTAVSAAIRENHRFYTQVLGMRLVKRSVNQDDVRAYHLFYADAKGSPGTDLTFFDWDVPRESRGTRSIVRTGLRVGSPESVVWWDRHLRDNGVYTASIVERDGRVTLDFEDPEGQRFALVDDGGRGDTPAIWERSPIPAEHQIRGLGPITLSVPTLSPTEALLTQVLEMRRARTYDHTTVFEMGPESNAGPHAELHVSVQPELPAVQPGAGGVHHVALRTPTEETYHAWTARLDALRVPNSGEVDRYWFRSLYFREPAGILFEIATDGPGFAVDEAPETLGEKVVLPPFLEPHRAQILAGLKSID